MTICNCVARRLNNTSQRLNSSTLAVRSGSIYLYSQDIARVQMSAVDRVVIHPWFNVASRSVLGDMALLRLARPFNVTDSVRPVCTHSDAANAQPGSGRFRMCVVTGWAPSRAASSCMSRFALL